MLPRQPRTRRAALPVNHPQMPALGPAFDTPDEAARYAHVKIGQKRDREYGGFILQRVDGKYLATEPLPGLAFEFDPNTVFPQDDVEGVLLLPVGHEEYAIYHSHPSRLAGLQAWSPAERATYQNGFSPDDIFVAISEREFSPASYLSAPDGSLIKYTVSNCADESKLFEQVASSDLDSEPGSNPGDSQIYEAFKQGSMMPSDFVRKVAHAGDLRVIIGSELWGPPGQVRADWKPYPLAASQIRTCESVWPPQAIVLSKQFVMADDAARYVHQQLGRLPRPEVVGFLLKNTESGAFRIAEPWANGEACYAPCSVFHPEEYYRPPLPEGWRIDGLYFAPALPDTVPAPQLLDSFFRPADLHRMFEYQYVPRKRPKGLPVRYGFTFSNVYFCAADGALLSYRPSKSEAEYELARRVSTGYSLRESIQYQLATGMIQPVEFVREVARAGQLRVLAVGRNWPQEGVFQGRE
ncbi:MAG TPA: DUF4329 domain-containing protein [Pseudomonas sp.]|jgi:hypothetical protein